MTDVDVRGLAVPGAYEFTPAQHGDHRGRFLEWFQATSFSAHTGHQLDVAQANCSVSAAGTLRGIHFADVPPGQAKYVTCVLGAVLDMVVDLRVGSPTFGVVDTVRLDDVDRRCVYLAEGLGHAFLALQPNSTVIYLCSTPYAAEREHGVNPVDPGLRLPVPPGTELLLSEKDRGAPTLAQAVQDGLLPRWEDCRRHVELLQDRYTKGAT